MLLPQLLGGRIAFVAVYANCCAMALLRTFLVLNLHKEMAGKCYRGLFIEKDLSPFSVTYFKVIFN